MSARSRAKPWWGTIRYEREGEQFLHVHRDSMFGGWWISWAEIIAPDPSILRPRFGQKK